MARRDIAEDATIDAQMKTALASEHAVARIRMQRDECDCLEFWHEHPEAPAQSVPGPAPDGTRTYWVRFVHMDDRVVCPFGDSEIYGDPKWLVGRDRAEVGDNE